MNDLEICKRIAEIKDHDWTIIDGDLVVVDEKGNLSYGGTSWSMFNPLTDDALCLEFCYTDRIVVDFVDCPAGSGRAYFAKFEKEGGWAFTDYCDTANHAICLAIIISHNK